MLAYLSGAIEYSPDKGKRWRAELRPFLESLGHTVYDPSEDERKNLNAEELAHFREWKSTDLPRFQAAVRKIIDYDIDWIERKTDYIVCYWDEYAMKGAGTHGELTIAFRQNIPVYLVTPLAIASVSGWILGCCEQVFENFDQLKTFLSARYAPQLQSQGHK
jgi:hypothetical protein